MQELLPSIQKDKNLYCHPELPLVTVYDDNWFVRNDYDVLSVGQRNYLIQFFSQYGFKQKTGTSLVSDGRIIKLVKPNGNLAVSNYEPDYIKQNSTICYAVTPTMFAEALFHFALENKVDAVPLLKMLIDVCPFNIEWLRDVSYRSEIEQITVSTFQLLTDHQKQVIEEKFKMKKAL